MWPQKNERSVGELNERFDRLNFEGSTYSVRFISEQLVNLHNNDIAWEAGRSDEWCAILIPASLGFFVALNKSVAVFRTSDERSQCSFSK